VIPLSSAGQLGWSDGHTCLPDRVPDFGDRASSLSDRRAGQSRGRREERGLVLTRCAVCGHSGRLVNFFFFKHQTGETCYIADMGYGFKVFLEG
jgi:hypothetical protein